MFDMKVKITIEKILVGGPGSGKVTHCDSLMQEKKGVTHINMTDLLQQYAIGNDMPDFGVLSSKTVTEVLMLEMKMAPKAKTYLISGYPRNMRDVVEYSEKIQTVQGVILISWRQKILERQIDYGAKLGQVVLSLARMELNNFYRNVIPVAEYFDQSDMLISINGERVPAEVYQDFRVAVTRILGMQDNPPVFANGKVAPVPDDVVTTELPLVPAPSSTRISAAPTSERLELSPERPKTRVISVNPSTPNFRSPTKAYPSVLWVIGGPGSNKAVLCQNVASETGWQHVSLGRLLRSIADQPDAKKNKEIAKLKECISNGDMAPQNFVAKQVEKIMADNIGKPGLILDGYPRDMAQVAEFESRFQNYFRMRRETANKLIQKFQSSVYFPKNDGHGGRVPITAETHVYSFLWFAGNKATIKDVAQRFNMSESSFERIRERMFGFLLEIGPTAIKMRSTNAEKEKLSVVFQKFKQKPAVILLDCSKLQLGRGRLDDSVTAFRRRLEIFRQSSLPMLRAMDSIGRLTIVDGDTDAPPVQADFKNVVKEHIEYLKAQSQETVQNGYVLNGNMSNGHLSNGNLSNGNVSNGHAISNGHVPLQDTELEDLENEPIETISKSVSNGVHHMANGHAKTQTNGFVPNGFPNYSQATEIEGHI